MSERNPINPTLFLRPEELRRAADLLFFAHRDFSRLGRDILSAHGLGAADYRALHVIGRNPRIGVTQLMATLKVSKQSLHRTLAQLKERGFVTEAQSRNDRRQKELSLSESGAALVTTVEAKQHDRIMAAYRKAGPSAIASFWDILLQLTDPEDREGIRQALNMEDVAS